MTHYTTPMPHWLIRLLHVARRIFPRPNPQSGLPIFPIGLTQFRKWANPFSQMGSPVFNDNGQQGTHEGCPYTLTLMVMGDR